MKTRFEGKPGRRLLENALKEQRIVEHDSALASALSDAGELVEYQAGANIVVQGDTDNDVYFLLGGAADVLVHSRLVASRRKGEAIGEMAILSPSSRRSATVRATEDVLALRVTEPALHDIATQFPGIWKPIAHAVAERLREREKFHRPPSPLPVLFVGSSVETLPLAHEIVNGLKHDPVVARVWSTPGVFEPGGISIDVLLKEVDSCDFAAFVFGPDDEVKSRGEDSRAPRDNVVFELGLFLGRLERCRAFIVKEHSVDVKIPTDLLGVTPITYVSKAGQERETMLAPVCQDLRNAIARLGTR